MNHPWMFVAGCAIVGWFIPELLVLAKARVPVGMNIIAAIAGGLISASFVM